MNSYEHDNFMVLKQFYIQKYYLIKRRLFGIKLMNYVKIKECEKIL